ncbi:ABC transporter [Drepanopeziza brunnea f. sp. 'multigermtubi' MB_m1]|uniref:ABC transporter n=1 Tax=Marssonina brunnea f. sp. multigermtubi (strain MB_m1) TaxID=1072389 RepID=K1Y7C9_MARBU|nr:ABC transporter [Drepanopeziza brunnea f. sp. 'multigermtubi' MB_m1]EKD21039.1 ABC transporter [Drepanopeziza brunnea f. sp. 'multigermtubi' MB_m1]
MRKATTRINAKRTLLRRYGTSNARPPVISISNGTFYRHHPNSHHAATSSNPPLFQDLTFSLPSFASIPEYWAILGPSSSGKTTFLQILRGKHLCIPPAGRTYPFLSSDEIKAEDHRRRHPSAVIKQVGFDGEQGLGQQAPQSAYLSARYESRREDTDFSVLDYLLGNTELNPSDDDGKRVDSALLARVVKDLRLEELVEMPVSNLSNGQTRRARIASALLADPEVLLLDEPFMGLDPPTLLSLSPMLQRLAEANKPRLVLALRPQDPIPDWITHLIYLKGNCEVAFQGIKRDVLNGLGARVYMVQKGETEADPGMPLHSLHEVGRTLTKDGIVQESLFGQNLTQERVTFSRGGKPNASQAENTTLSRDGFPLHDIETPTIGEPLIEIQGVRVRYGDKTVLGNWETEVHGSKAQHGLRWDVKRGERWGIFGPNGSGKTTLLSLICSDHPQTYALPIKLFGRSRIPEPGQRGISIFDLQARIGHSSPEIHGHIPKSLTLRQVLENAWADTFRGVPKVDESAREKVDACLRWFERDLRRETSSVVADGTEWADQALFGGLPFSSQKVALFLRAIIKNPDLVILDEAFSGMDDGVRDRCLLFLAHGETKQFSSFLSARDMTKSLCKGPRIVDSDISKRKQVRVPGLGEEQALLCISHVREEIPGSIREWICLPEANTGKPARFGRLAGPIEGDYRRWNEIWGM